jgi:hypothetical protein
MSEEKEEGTKTENKEFIRNKRLSKKEVIKLLKRIEEEGTEAEYMYLLKLSSREGEGSYNILYGKVRTFSHKNDYNGWEYTFIIPVTEIVVLYHKDSRGLRFVYVFTPTYGWTPIKI